MKTTADWEKWGSKDPYFGVLSNEKFRNRNLTAAAKQEFFESGRTHVEHVLGLCRKHLDPGFAPRSALDFGCGTGRLVLPLAGLVERVVGVDVAESMLAEARKNCAERSISNVTLVKSDGGGIGLEGSFDFIHSFIVFQHIPVKHGMAIFADLLSRLNPRGVGALHFTYSKTRFADWDGAAPAGWNLLARFYRTAKRIHRKLFRHPDPLMEMNPYNTNQLLFCLQRAGVTKCHVEFSDHGGDLGVFILFQKP